MVLDQQNNQYYRSVFSFFDMFAFIGGFYGLFRILGGLLVNFIADRSFNCSVISDLYQIESDSSYQNVEPFIIEQQKEKNFQAYENQNNEKRNKVFDKKSLFQNQPKELF